MTICGLLRNKLENAKLKIKMAVVNCINCWFGYLNTELVSFFVAISVDKLSVKSNKDNAI